MKKSITMLTIVFLVLMCILSACEFSAEQSEQPFSPSGQEYDVKDKPDNTAGIENESVTDYSSIADIVPCLDSAKNLYVFAGHTSYEFGGSAYAKADEEQKKRIIYLLKTLDMTDFVVCGIEGKSGATIELLVEGVNDTCKVRIVNSGDALYIVLLPTEMVSIANGIQLTAYEGPIGSFSFVELSNICSDILSDTDDLDNAGMVRVMGDSVTEHVLNKGNSAIVQNILDGTIANADIYGGSEELVFDVLFIIGDVTYMIDTTSGYFSRECGGDAVFSKMEDRWLREVLGRLGLQGAMVDTEDEEGDFLTIYMEYKDSSQSFEIQKDITVATDEEFSNTLRKISLVQTENRYVYKFALNENVDAVFIKPPVAYLPVDIDLVSLVPVVGGTAKTDDGLLWFTISSVNLSMRTGEECVITILIIPYNDMLPKYPRLVYKEISIGALSSLNFNQNGEFDSGEFTFHVPANNEDSVRLMLENSALIVGSALVRIHAEDLVFTSSAGTIFVISD